MNRLFNPFSLSLSLSLFAFSTLSFVWLISIDNLQVRKESLENEWEKFSIEKKDWINEKFIKALHSRKNEIIPHWRKKNLFQFLDYIDIPLVFFMWFQFSFCSVFLLDPDKPEGFDEPFSQQTRISKLYFQFFSTFFVWRKKKCSVWKLRGFLYFYI